MIDEPYFITVDEAVFFHGEEIKRAGGVEGIRDPGGLEAALAAPQAAFGGAYLMGDLFEMAAAYVESVCALTFLLLNGYEIDEAHDEELADMVLDLVTHQTDRAGLADYFRERVRQTE